MESIVFSGEIRERQRDRETREVKFVFSGLSLEGEPCGLVAKIGKTGRIVVITVYRDNGGEK